MKTYNRQGIPIYCADKKEEALTILKSLGLTIKKSDFKSLTDALNRCRRLSLEGISSAVAKWSSAGYAVGESVYKGSH